MTSEQAVAGKRRRTPAEIEQLVREFASSGLNRTQFCRQQGLTLGVLNRSLRRLQGREGCRAESGDRLIAVELAGKIREVEPARSCGLAVVLGRGRQIAVSTGFDAATLQRLVHVLERM
jgi:hypothetical protein